MPSVQVMGFVGGGGGWWWCSSSSSRLIHVFNMCRFCNMEQRRRASWLSYMLHRRRLAITAVFLKDMTHITFGLPRPLPHDIPPPFGLEPAPWVPVQLSLLDFQD